MSLKHKALTLGVALAALVGTTTGAYAATAYATSPVNVRTGPGPGYRVVDVLRRGEAVEIDYCQGTWCAVSKSGPDGWVSANYLSRGGGSYDDDYYDDDAYYDDDYYYDDDFYIDRPRVIKRYPRRIYRDYGPAFSACVGSPNASFCIYD
jgi:uncharacterized protein YraI